jgi:hypothetical protein
MSDIGYDNKYFYIGQQPNGGNDIIAGLTNIAMFLSQAMVQSIQDDACDEHNIQLVSGKYPVSNSCGQFGLSYQDINCTGADADMTCPLDPNQSFSGVTRPLALRAPQPFRCAPKSQFPGKTFLSDKAFNVVKTASQTVQYSFILKSLGIGTSTVWKKIIEQHLPMNLGELISKAVVGGEEECFVMSLEDAVFSVR